MIDNMNQVLAQSRLFLNLFSLTMLLVFTPVLAAKPKPKVSIQEEARRMRATQIQEMQAKSKELLDARNLSPEVKKMLEAPAPKRPSPEEEARMDARDKAEMAAKRRKLTPEEEAKVKKFLSERKSNQRKSEGKLDLKKEPESAGKDKKEPVSRTFKKGIEKSPTEYGNSTATPGEAEKEAIEYQGKSPTKKPKVQDADQE